MSNRASIELILNAISFDSRTQLETRSLNVGLCRLSCLFYVFADQIKLHPENFSTIQQAILFEAIVGHTYR